MVDPFIDQKEFDTWLAAKKPQRLSEEERRARELERYRKRNLNRKQEPEFHAQQLKSARKQRADPERNAKLCEYKRLKYASQKKRRSWDDPELRKQQAETVKRIWARRKQHVHPD